MLAWWLGDRYRDLYHRLVQEDHWLEWATVWAFLLAAAAAPWEIRGDDIGVALTED